MEDLGRKIGRNFESITKICTRELPVGELKRLISKLSHLKVKAEPETQIRNSRIMIKERENRGEKPQKNISTSEVP